MPSLSLSTKGLNKLKNDLNDQNFKFIINNQEEYLCPKILADFLSPLIFKIHQIDPTLLFFNLKINNYEKYFFQKIIDLLYGNEIEFKEEEKLLLFEISKILGNIEILNNYINQIPQNITKENIIKIINEKNSLNLSIENEILYLSKNFYLFKENQLKILNLEILKELFNNKSLKIENENNLFQLIQNIIFEKDEKY